MSLPDCLVVQLDFARVAGVRIADIGNGTGAEGNHVALGARRIALEIALNRPVFLRHGKLIGFLSKVVHSDIPIPVCRQCPNRIEHHVDALGGTREFLGNNPALGFENVR